jgi:hypothetical protein
MTAENIESLRRWLREQEDEIARLRKLLRDLYDYALTDSLSVGYQQAADIKRRVREALER